MVFNPSSSGFFGHMSFDVPDFDASVRTSIAHLAQPRGADFEIDPNEHFPLQEHDEADDMNDTPVIEKQHHRAVHVEDFDPPPLAELSSPESSPEGPETPRMLKRADKGFRNQDAPGSSDQYRRDGSPNRSAAAPGRKELRRSSSSNNGSYRKSARRLSSTFGEGEEDPRTPNETTSSRRLSVTASRRSLLKSAALTGVYPTTPSSREASASPAGQFRTPTRNRTITSEEEPGSRDSNTRSKSRRNLALASPDPAAPPAPPEIDFATPSPHANTHRKTLVRCQSDDVTNTPTSSSHRVTRKSSFQITPSKSDTPSGRTSRRVERTVSDNTSDTSTSQHNKNTSGGGRQATRLSLLQTAIISASKTSRQQVQAQRQWSSANTSSKPVSPSVGKADRGKNHQNQRSQSRSPSRSRRGNRTITTSRNSSGDVEVTSSPTKRQQQQQQQRSNSRSPSRSRRGRILASRQHSNRSGNVEPAFSSTPSTPAAREPRSRSMERKAESSKQRRSRSSDRKNSSRNLTSSSSRSRSKSRSRRSNTNSQRGRPRATSPSGEANNITSETTTKTRARSKSASARGRRRGSAPTSKSKKETSTTSEENSRQLVQRAATGVPQRRDHQYFSTFPTALISPPREEQGVVFSQGDGYVVNNEAYKSKKEESKARRSGIMKSLKDLLVELDSDDQASLKFEIQPDGTKRLVMDLSDLNTVMEEFSALRR